MSYIAMGDMASSDFNSTKYPGISKPSNVNALAQFKAMQTQLSRVATVTGNSPIASDGDIGPGTVTLYKAVAPQLEGWATANMDVSDMAKLVLAVAGNIPLATYADVVTEAARGYADSKGAAGTPPAPKPTKPPVLVSPDGIETPAPAMTADLLAAWKGTSTPMKVAAVAVLGGIGYMLLKKPKGKRR